MITMELINRGIDTGHHLEYIGETLLERPTQAEREAIRKMPGIRTFDKYRYFVWIDREASGLYVVGQVRFPPIPLGESMGTIQFDGLNTRVNFCKSYTEIERILKQHETDEILLLLDDLGTMLGGR